MSAVQQGLDKLMTAGPEAQWNNSLREVSVCVCVELAGHRKPMLESCSRSEACCLHLFPVRVSSPSCEHCQLVRHKVKSQVDQAHQKLGNPTKPQSFILSLCRWGTL